MKKNPGNKMPTTKVLLLYSWLIAIVALIACVYLIFQSRGFNSLLLCLSILLGGFLFATIIRTLGNIAQMFFDLHILLWKFKYERDNKIQELVTQLETQNYNVIQILKQTTDNTQELITETKQIKANVKNIESFFEEVAKEE
jgi:hypothetical protein